MRRLGYAFIDDRHTGKQSYIRPLNTANRYPRFHIYITKSGIDNSYVFDIHLDQKHASYEGKRMHNAEHEGEVVETEVARIKSQLSL